MYHIHNIIEWSLSSSWLRSTIPLPYFFKCKDLSFQPWETLKSFGRLSKNTSGSSKNSFSKGQEIVCDNFKVAINILSNICTSATEKLVKKIT